MKRKQYIYLIVTPFTNAMQVVGTDVVHHANTGITLVLNHGDIVASVPKEGVLSLHDIVTKENSEDETSIQYSTVVGALKALKESLYNYMESDLRNKSNLSLL